MEALPQEPPAEVLQAALTAAARHSMPERILLGVAWVESRFHNGLTSSAGAQGVWQFMPSTAKGLGLADPFNIDASADAAARFLKGLFRQFGGDWTKVMAAYNWGPGHVNRNPDPQSWPSSVRKYAYDVWRAAQAVQIPFHGPMAILGPTGAVRVRL